LPDLQSYNRVVGAINKKSLDAACAILSTTTKGELIRVRDIKTAEAAKLLEVIYRDANIGLANEFAVFCENAGIDYMEAMAAANSQPYSHLHIPGVGVGGHCLRPEEFIFVNNTGSFNALGIGLCVESTISKANDGFQGSEDQRVPVSNFDVLSFDMKCRRAKYSKVKWFSKRRYSGVLVKVKTSLGRELTVTPDHPTIRWVDGSFAIVPAEQLRCGDLVPIATYFPWESDKTPVVIDLIEEISRRGNACGLKVKLAKGGFGRHRKILSSRLRLLATKRWERAEFLRRNYLPLQTYLELERMGPLPFERRGLLLYSGRGKVNFVPAVIEPDQEFWRLVGYFLSEGCITSDKTLRVRFAFNKKEHYLIRDVTKALQSIGVRYSESLFGNVRHIRVSSRVFGFLFKDVLECGMGSHDKSIPTLVFKAGRVAAKNVLAGLIRGDGGIEDNRGVISIQLATASSKMYQQALLLMQGLGFVPALRQFTGKKSTGPAYSMRILGWEQLQRAREFLIGQPRRQLEKALGRYSRIRRKLRFTPKGNFALVSVNLLERVRYDGFVYNMEVEGSHTFITSSGMVTHNCLPVYPYMLMDEAKSQGVKLRIVKTSRSMNEEMPKHVLSLAANGLRSSGKPLRRARVTVLGISYRPNVKEIRFSPAIELISLLKRRGARVTIYDPQFSCEEISKLGHVAEPTLKKAVEKADCVIIAVAHDEFRRLDARELAALMGRSPVIVDCAHLIDPAQAEKSRVTYRGVGRGLWTK